MARRKFGIKQRRRQVKTIWSGRRTRIPGLRHQKKASGFKPRQESEQT